jgi:hypothetical protein
MSLTSCFSLNPEEVSAGVGIPGDPKALIPGRPGVEPPSDFPHLFLVLHWKYTPNNISGRATMKVVTYTARLEVEWNNK